MIIVTLEEITRGDLSKNSIPNVQTIVRGRATITLGDGGEVPNQIVITRDYQTEKALKYNVPNVEGESVWSLVSRALAEPK